MKASDTVYYQSKPMDRLSYERLRSQNMMVKSSTFGGEKTNITLLQGIGGYVKSGGTHITGGCYDTTAYNQKNRVYCGRLLGGADWFRPYNWDNAKGGDHIHHNTIGAGYASGAAQRQWTAYYAGRNGLANNAADNGPRLATKPLFVAPWTDRGRRGVYYLKKSFTARTEGSTSTKSKGVVPKGAKFTVIGIINNGGTLWGINKNGLHIAMSALGGTPPVGAPTPKMAIRVGTQNIPAPGVGSGGDLGHDADRAARFATLLKAADLDAIGIQEGGARKGDADPSDFMDIVMTEVGSAYGLIVPTTAWNENYILYRKSTLNWKDQPDDFIFREGYEGKHLTQSILVDEASDKEFYFGSTQLVNNRTGALKQGPVMLAGARKAAGTRLAVVVGDMNTEKIFSASTWPGALQIAGSTTNGQMSTYRSYSKPAPENDPLWIIDQLRLDTRFACKGYTVVADLDAAGRFHQPRPSDHLLTIASIVER